MDWIPASDKPYIGSNTQREKDMKAAADAKMRPTVHGHSSHGHSSHSHSSHSQPTPGGYKSHSGSVGEMDMGWIPASERVFSYSHQHSRSSNQGDGIVSGSTAGGWNAQFVHRGHQDDQMIQRESYADLRSQPEIGKILNKYNLQRGGDVWSGTSDRKGPAPLW